MEQLLSTHLCRLFVDIPSAHRRHLLCQALPDDIRCTSASFERHLHCEGALALCEHTFWYVYYALHEKDSGGEQVNQLNFSQLVSLAQPLVCSLSCTLQPSRCAKPASALALYAFLPTLVGSHRSNRLEFSTLILHRLPSSTRWRALSRGSCCRSALRGGCMAISRRKAPAARSSTRCCAATFRTKAEENRRRESETRAEDETSPEKENRSRHRARWERKWTEASRASHSQRALLLLHHLCLLRLSCVSPLLSAPRIALRLASLAIHSQAWLSDRLP